MICGARTPVHAFRSTCRHRGICCSQCPSTRTAVALHLLSYVTSLACPFIAEPAVQVLGKARKKNVVTRVDSSSGLLTALRFAVGYFGRESTTTKKVMSLPGIAKAMRRTARWTSPPLARGTHGTATLTSSIAMDIGGSLTKLVAFNPSPRDAVDHAVRLRIDSILDRFPKHPGYEPNLQLDMEHGTYSFLQCVSSHSSPCDVTPWCGTCRSAGLILASTASNLDGWTIS